MMCSNVEMDFPSLRHRCQSRGTFWHLTAPTGRRSTSSSSRWNYLSLCSNILKGISSLQRKSKKMQTIILVSWQVDVEGTVVENLARRCGGFLKSLSLNGCQVNIELNIIWWSPWPTSRQWGTLPCPRLPSTATTSSGSTWGTARSSRTGLASSSPGIAVNSRFKK